MKSIKGLLVIEYKDDNWIQFHSVDFNYFSRVEPDDITDYDLPKLIMTDKIKVMSDQEFNELLELIDSKSKNCKMYQSGLDEEFIGSHLTARFQDNYLNVFISNQECEVPESLRFSGGKNTCLSEFIRNTYKDSLGIGDLKNYLTDEYESIRTELLNDLESIKHFYGVE